jgi:hypothetical protein
MDSKIITEDIILNADTYIPIETKSAMAIEYAKSCVTEVQVAIDKNDPTSVLPPRYQENPMLKSLYGMMTLLAKYLHLLQPNDDGDVTLSTEEYNEWGKACVMNQLDRMKSSKNIEVRNRVYDILDDYREFYRMLGVEISALVANKNDFLSRFLQYFSMSITPDMFKDAFANLAESLTEIKDNAEQHNGEPKDNPAVEIIEAE